DFPRSGASIFSGSRSASSPLACRPGALLMAAYILRRILLMIPTILGIMAISFAVIQFAPGGPVEQVIAKITGQGGDAGERLSGGGGSDAGQNFDYGGESSKYRGAQGLDPEFIAKLEKQFGFDKPPLERFALMLWNYARFDFGESYFRDISVVDLILEKMPVSISIGLRSEEHTSELQSREN